MAASNLGRKTLLSIGAFVLGSFAFVALVSVVLMWLTGKMFPDHDNKVSSTNTDSDDLTEVATEGKATAFNLRRCCLALQQNARSAPPEQQTSYLAASGVCQSLQGSPDGQRAVKQIEAMLKDIKLPSACIAD